MHHHPDEMLEFDFLDQNLTRYLQYLQSGPEGKAIQRSSSMANHSKKDDIAAWSSNIEHREDDAQELQADFVLDGNHERGEPRTCRLYLDRKLCDVMSVSQPSDDDSREPELLHQRSSKKSRDWTKKQRQQVTGTGVDEPAILWKATVFPRVKKHDNARMGPPVIYHDDRPLELNSTNRYLRPSKTEALHIGIEKPVQGMHYPSWKGCVFEVVVRAEADEPLMSVPTHLTGSKSPILNSEIAAMNLQSPVQPRLLKVSRTSRTGIAIRSPFLYLKLQEIAGYYPGFRLFTAGKLADLSCTSSLEIDDEFTIFEPFGVLMHNFHKMAVIANAAPNDIDSRNAYHDRQAVIAQLQAAHVQQLYEFLKPRYDTDVVSAQRQLKNDPPLASFTMLWYVFRPGTDVYVRGANTFACVIMGIRNNIDNSEFSGASSGDEVGPNKITYWIIDLWCLATDGTKIGRSPSSCRIASYDGLKELVSLDVCPVSIWDNFDDGERRRAIMRRSKLMYQALQQKCLLVHYDGPIEGYRQYSGNVVIDFKRGLHQSNNFPRIVNSMKDCCDNYLGYDNILVNEDKKSGGEALVDEQEETMMVEQKPMQEWHYNSTRSTAGMDSDYQFRAEARGSMETDKMIKRDLNDHQLLLLWPETTGFVLKMKQWYLIFADNIHAISPSEESIKNLVLGEDELKIIRSISRRQNSKKDTWAADFIEGKGRGQIILLHGPPGVGKTYTVEAIAEWLHRPLLALTVADIGTVETRVERELIKWFSLAEAWNAVLLVDEADIFLERRQNRDLARNGLVSAFLRRMEYFTGLLFLTTNRVGQIDDAFVSRVHIAIGYTTLNGEDRKKIWNGFFQKLIRERAGKIQISPAAKSWVLEMAESGKAQLNGRDIRNALQTAITLAEAEAEEDPDYAASNMTIIVDLPHFQRVLDISYKFHEYVKSIRREDEKKRAAGRYDRNDYWKYEDGQI